MPKGPSQKPTPKSKRHENASVREVFPEIEDSPTENPEDQPDEYRDECDDPAREDFA